MKFHLMFGFFQAAWTFHMVEALVAFFLAPPLASKAPQCLPLAPVDLHLLLQDVLGHDVPLLGAGQDGEGCSYEHPNPSQSPVQKIVVALHLPPLLHAPDHLVHLGPLCSLCFSLCLLPLCLSAAAIQDHQDDQDGASDGPGRDSAVDGRVERRFSQRVASGLVTFACSKKSHTHNDCN